MESVFGIFQHFKYYLNGIDFTNRSVLIPPLWWYSILDFTCSFILGQQSEQRQLAPLGNCLYLFSKLDATCAAVLKHCWKQTRPKFSSGKQTSLAISQNPRHPIVKQMQTLFVELDFYCSGSIGVLFLSTNRSPLEIPLKQGCICRPSSRKIWQLVRTPGPSAALVPFPIGWKS